MSLTRDIHTIEIAGHTVAVTGATGPVHARWTLLVDDVEVDTARAAGEFTLRGPLGDGSEITADVYQSLMGPTRVTFFHDGKEYETTKGFVA
jgi:hypothetical protein